MNLNIEKLPRQTKYNAKIQHFVVKLDGAEIGVIEKIPNRPFAARLMGAIQEVGRYPSKEDAAIAIYKTHKAVKLMRLSVGIENAATREEMR